MKLLISTTLLAMIIVQPLYATNEMPECPTQEQIKDIKIVGGKEGYDGYWRFWSAPFEANGAEWNISFTQYISPSPGSIDWAQNAWNHALIGAPDSLPPTSCQYFDNANNGLDWIYANLNEQV